VIQEQTRKGASMEQSQERQSTVEMCGVTMCSYNQAQRCTAGAITVDVVEGMAHCVTFTPREGAVGIGSTSVRDHTRTQHDEPTT
jgi:hypothetical protein